MVDIKNISCLTLAIPLLALAVAGCSLQSAIGPADSDGFKSNNYKLILGFDLRSDKNPRAFFVVNSTSNISKIEKYHIILPFESRAVEMNRNIFATWGSYQGYTILSYILSPNTIGFHSITLTPVFGKVPDANFFAQDLTRDLDEHVYFIRSGLERRFIYRYPKFTNTPIT
ncbi:MAG: hypothetical protein M3380_13135, partial [Chloroflexota bacterium]|nr:hypothetical protein [Chloroflexota bacterium]